MNKLGFSEREIQNMYYNKWCELFEQYQYTYNFEKQSNLYNVEVKKTERKVDSVDSL